MTGLGTATALLRGLHLAAILSLLGTAGFVAWMLPAATAVPEVSLRRLNRLCWFSALTALLAGVAWFALQAAAIADAETLSDAPGALPLVAAHTRFGMILMLRLAAVLAVIPGRRAVSLWLTIVLAAIALGLKGLMGHAGATGGAVGDGLVLSESLHLLGAGIWLGALLPLWLSLRTLAPLQAALVCERFSPIGLACVLVLAGTGFAQGLQLIGSLVAAR